MRPPYLRLFRWHVLRYVRQHRLLSLLNVLSVGLGVAVFLATQLANQSANRAFAATVDLVAGKADLQIMAPGGVPEIMLPQCARVSGVAAATPLVRGFVTLPDFPGEYLDVLGIDVFTNEPFRTFDAGSGDLHGDAFEEWLGDPQAIAVTAQFANEHNLRRGDTLRVQVNGAERELRVAFIFNAEALADPHIAALDVGWAQELFGQRGRLSAIQLRLANGASRQDVVRRLRKIAPADATIAPPAQRNEQVEKMLGGFELNLTAMSLVSLLVGMFLIYNAISASVVRRKHELGILRSLGTTRKEVRALFLGEAALLGAIGTTAGLAGGFLLAHFLVRIVAGTISSLYVLVNVNAVRVTPWIFVAAAFAGLLAVLCAAWLPANTAAKLDPVRALIGSAAPEQASTRSRRWIISGIGALLLAIIFSRAALMTGPPWLGFGAAFFVLAGFSLLVPPSASSFSATASGAFRYLRRRRARSPVELELASANLGRALMRNAVTIASLAAAVAMTVGVTVMVFSFRTTVASWINQTLLADLFIAPASNEIVGPTSFIPPELIDFLQNNRAVADVDTFREIDLPFRGSMIALAVVRGSERRQLQFVRGNAAEIMRRFHQEQCVLISESFARRQHMHDGQLLELATPAGPQRFHIAGIFYDYTRDQGVVYMSAQKFAQLWNDKRVNSVAVYLNEGASAQQLTTEIRERFSRAGEFAIYSNRALRARIFEIFDQTFAVTYVLRAIAVVVALVGIFLSLTTLIIERARELAVLRAIGASGAQVRRLLLFEAMFVGLLASIVGIASGICLSFVLTGVINRAFFGWTVRLDFPWGSLGATPVWIVAAALAAAIIPAWRASKVPLAETLRSE